MGAMCKGSPAIDCPYTPGLPTDRGKPRVTRGRNEDQERQDRLIRRPGRANDSLRSVPGMYYRCCLRRLFRRPLTHRHCLGTRLIEDLHQLTGDRRRIVTDGVLLIPQDVFLVALLDHASGNHLDTQLGDLPHLLRRNCQQQETVTPEPLQGGLGKELRC